MNYTELYPNLTLLTLGKEGVLGTAIDWNTMLTRACWNNPDVRLDLMRYAADRLREALLIDTLDVLDLYYDGHLCVSEVADIAGLPDMFDNGIFADVLDTVRRMVLLAHGYISPEERRKRELTRCLMTELKQGNLQRAQHAAEQLSKMEE